MAHIESFGRKHKNQNILKYLWNKYRSLDSFTKTIIIAVILLALATPVVVKNIFNTQNHAATITGTIVMSPSTATVPPGQTFTVAVVLDGGGTAFNAAQATVPVSTNLTVQSLTITPPTSGGCNFNFVVTPTAANPTFAGAILGSSSTHCQLYTMTVLANTTGTGTISLPMTGTTLNASMKAFSDNSEMLQSTTGGTYTLANPTPTPLPKTATINVSPATGSPVVGSTFNVTVGINGGGQTFNAAQATVTVSPNLSVVSLNAPATTPCNFSYTVTPSTTNPSFTGAILSSSSTSCNVYTLAVQAVSAGTGTITITNGSVKEFNTNQEIFLSATNGSYSVLAPTPTPLPTATPTPLPTATPTPLPTATPTPKPTNTPTPLPTNTPIPTATPIPPTPTPYPAPTVNPIALCSSCTSNDTYATAVTLTGSKLTSMTQIFVNNSSASVTLPTSTTWQASNLAVVLGNNLFTVFGKDASGVQSLSIATTVRRHGIGDVNGDAVVDLTDVSLFAVDWQKHGGYTNLSDMNNDGVADLTDFSLLASNYGNHYTYQ